MRKKEGMNRKGKVKSKSGWMIMILIALGVMIVSLFQLCQISSEYKKSDREYRKIADAVISKQTDEKAEHDEEMDFSQKERTVWIDFQKLASVNEELVCWIRFDEELHIDYPVVQGTDNEKYLKTTFEGAQNSAGCLFTDYRNSADLSDQNTFIYGHNMKNGSMFGKLRKYKDRAFYEKHPYFFIYTPDGKEHIYEIFAISIVNDADDAYRIVFEDERAVENYMEYIQGICLYSKETEVNDKKIISLSTCTNVTEEQRLLVQGVKIMER